MKVSLETQRKLAIAAIIIFATWLVINLISLIMSFQSEEEELRRSRRNRRGRRDTEMIKDRED